MTKRIVNSEIFDTQGGGCRVLSCIFTVQMSFHCLLSHYFCFHCENSSTEFPTPVN